jgi:uncharacterized protein with von Willebrand factor type A (vWA) domain
MKLIKCGSKVRTKVNDIEAIITAVSIRFDSVSYELSYFNNGEYKSCWLNENEFEAKGLEKTSIGFK